MRLIDAPTVNAIPISDNATNGDIVKAMFPSCEVYEHKVKTNSEGDIVIGYDVFLYAYHPNDSKSNMGFGIKVFFDCMWWNAPYNPPKQNLAPSVARACSILEDDCPYDIPCAECEVHCSIERAKQKLKGDKENDIQR